MKPALRIQDVTLRDGMHAIRQQSTVEQIRNITQALVDAGVAAIEVAHGDGLAGSSFNHGFGARTDEAWITASAEVIANFGKGTKLTTLLLPGIGTLHDLKRARDPACTACASPRTAPRPMPRRSTSRQRATGAWTWPGF